MLLNRDQFIGLEDVTHLCAGGETPMLRTHMNAVERFMADKALGETARFRLEETYTLARERAAQLLHVPAADVAFLSSSSEGINLIAHALPWQAGDNIIVADVEFPSDVLPWTRLASQGVELRLVRHHDWQITLDAIAAQIDGRTRLVAVSLVSYFTGQRLPLAALADLVHSHSALLCVDITHAAGVIAVDASLADFVVSSCYKWLLGVHGVAIFYVNPRRVGHLAPPFVGWHSGKTVPDWRAPTAVDWRQDATRFVPGNPSFLSLYVLANALERLLDVGITAIEAHVATLSQQLWEGLATAGWPMMSSGDPRQRAGNVCFMTENIAAITEGLAEQKVLIWGGYAGVGRIRVSTHLYNDAADLDRFFTALARLSVPVS